MPFYIQICNFDIKYSNILISKLQISISMRGQPVVLNETRANKATAGFSAEVAPAIVTIIRGGNAATEVSS